MLELDLSPGKLVLHKIDGYPPWPCRIISWDLYDQTDPCQLTVPEALQGDAVDEEVTRRDVLLLYLGKAIDFSSETRTSKSLVDWNALKGDLSSVSASEDLVALAQKYKAGGHFPETLHPTFEFEEYMPALREAFELDEKAGDREWFFNTYGAEKYKYSDTWVQGEEYAQMKAAFERKKEEHAAKGGEKAGGQLEDPRSAMKKLAERKRKQRELEEGHAAEEEDEDYRYTSSGRNGRGGSAMEDEDYEVDAGEGGEKKAAKKKKVAQPAGKMQRTGKATASTSKPISVKGSEKLREDSKRKAWTMEEWKEHFKMVKTILSGDNYDKTAKYSAETLDACHIFASEYMEKLEKVNLKLKKLEEFKHNCEKDLESISGDLKIVSNDLLKKWDKYGKDEHISQGFKLGKLVQRFRKHNAPFLKSKYGQVIGEEFTAVIENWTKKFSGQQNQQQEGNKSLVTLSPKHGHWNRERCSNMLAMLFQNENLRASIGMDIEEELYGRHGEEGMEAYQEDIKKVYSALKGDGENDTKTPVMTDLQEGKISPAEFVSRVTKH
ncbi:hypothetical protein HOP50_03g26790 [Chloropicon primus]|uniref:PWWP domain-containing protein n=2 Tax=Chloropicon primus TaxID=1764295 RepID=A0A5B8MIN8_9CHLO|nr:hypothetical protein A3770_03p26790 [Chloropicon primus]UPQ99372.1 hypothetical protein HOP50_03g26790 [Chloropicon primus]|eukprot:QDZ20161.1 hypothetical protein A3770_03p26790 [Chloropicon primus]